MIPVKLYTPDGTLVDLLATSRVEVSRNVEQIGTLTLTCLKPKAIGKDYRIVIEHPAESRVLWLVSDYEETVIGDQSVLSVSAVDGKDLYQRRFVWAYNDTAQGYKINYPQVVAKEVINENMVSASLTERNISGMVAASFPTGLTSSLWTAWEGEVSWKPVWDVLTTLMEHGRGTDNPFMVDLLVESQGGTGLVPVITRRLGVSRTLNSFQLQRMGISVRITYSAKGAAHRVLALGAGDGSLALVSYDPAVVLTAGSSNPFYYSEAIVTSGNEDDLGALAATASARRAALQPKLSLVLEGAAPVRNFWGTTMGYGDQLLVSHAGVEYDVTVTGYSLSWAGAEEPAVSVVVAEGY